MKRQLLLVMALLLSPAIFASTEKTSMKDLPIVLQYKISQNFGKDDSAYHIKKTDLGYTAVNHLNGVTGLISEKGLQVRVKGFTWSLLLKGLNSGGTYLPLNSTRDTVSLSDNKLEFRSHGLTSWYINGPLGIQQGWTLEKRLSGNGGYPSLCFEEEGDLSAGNVPEKGSSLSLACEDGTIVLNYQGLYAYDALGKVIPAWFEKAGKHVCITLDDKDAIYPVTIDPYVQAAKLTASDGGINDYLGTSVSVSSDGSTVVAGAPFVAAVVVGGHTGAAYVYVKMGGVWTQAAKLTASDGANNDQLGNSVSVSSDGSTVVAGALYNAAGASGSGAAYVYVRPGVVWGNTTQTAKLTASDGADGDNLGTSVSVSSDGSIIVAGAPYANGTGAAYVYVRPGATWFTTSTFTAKLTASDGNMWDLFGNSVSVSSDGSTVVAGAPNAAPEGYQGGAAYVYVKTGGIWTQAAILSDPLCVTYDNMGYSVSVNSDGSTVVAGVPAAAAVAGGIQRGAAYVFARWAWGWDDHVRFTKLTASDGANYDRLGTSVSFSSDGSTVVAGAPYAVVGGVLRGAAYVYVKPGGWWSWYSAGGGTETEDAKLTASDGANGDNLGYSVSVSSNGSTIVAGAPYANAGGIGSGAAYVFGAQLNATASVLSNVSCYGGSNGSVTVSVSGGATPYSYDWSTSPVQHTQSATGLTAGTYWVTVTDANSSTATSSTSVSQPASPLSAAAGMLTNVSCYGGSNGSTNVMVSGGTTSYSYDWSTIPVQHTQSATGLTAGTYWVTVTDANSCTATSSTSVSQPASPLSATAGVLSNVICYGGSNGSTNVTVSGGTTSYSYAWSTTPMQYTQSATGLTAGTYWVTVTDANSCTATSSASVSQPASPLSATADVLTNVSCYGGSNGSTNVTVSGGTASYSYAWSTTPVQYTQSATGLTAGTYWVTVTDANTCTVTSSATVTQPASALTAVASVVNNVSIYQGSDGLATVTPGGGTTPYSYSWSTIPSQTAQTASSLTAGTYWVTITDANSCTATSSVTITQPTPPSGQVTDLLFSNVGGHQFQVDWIRGNGDGCAVFVLQGTTGLAPPVNNTSYPANTVFGNPASEIGSTGWYCVYDGTGTTVTVTGLSPSATYRVHICEYKLGSKTYNTGSASNNPLNQTTNSSLGATASVISNVSCYGGSDGSVTVSVSGGNPSYTYSWSTIPAQPTQTVSALTAGTYTVTVTDGVGETVTSSATVTQPTAALSASAGVLTNVSCFGGSNGSAEVTVSGGTSAYTYAWSTSPVQYTQSATGLTAGTYWVTVTDANSCTAISSATVTQPAVLTANSGVLTNVSCFGGSDGSAEVTVSGGTTSYSYAWSTAPVQHTQSATDLTAGTYWVTVTDANSCTAISSTTVTQPALLTANAGVITNVSCYGGSNGSTNVTVSGGTTSYSYAWSTTPVQHTQSATGLTAGTYWVTVTDANSCTATSSTTVTQPAVLTANAGVLTNVSCYGESNGSTNVTVSGGTTSYTYAWSTSPVQHTQSATGLTAGTYWVTVTDANSCTATSSATLTQPPMVVPGLTGPGTVCQNYPGNIYITESGMSNYHWVVSSGGIVTAGGTTLDNSVTITWNLPGAKSVSVNYSTPAGCTADDPTIKNITVNPAPAPDISGPTVVNQGETATYSTPFVSGHLYNWNVVFGTFISCEPGCITVNWAHYCNITVPGQVTVTETIPETGCSKMVTLLITIN